MPSSSVQGLASGIQWQDLVDKLSAAESARTLGPLTARITSSQRQSAAWTSYKLAATKLSAAAAKLRDGTALATFRTDVATSAASGKALLAATTSAAAAPGAYQVEVLALARAEKLSGAAFGSATAALGVAGDVVVNGRKIAIVGTDSLNNVRDRINAANAGATPSGVTATVLATAGGASRLVLSSDAAGARGLDLVDSSSTGGVLTSLGLVDGSYGAVTDAAGATTSAAFTSADAAIGGQLGIAVPAATTIRAGNRTIAVDLASDTLTTIAARLTAAGIGARLVTATEGGVARTRLKVDADLAAVPSAGDAAVPDADSLRALQLLGAMRGGRAAVAQSVASTALTDGADATATGATLLTALKANGASANLQDGDSISVSGRRGDGTAVTVSLAVGAATTVDDLLAQLNGNAAFGGGSRTATASIGDDGRLRLTDAAGGDSQLTLSLGVQKSVANGGGTTSLGAFTVQTAGRTRAVVTGSDAQLRVDGVLFTRPGNTVTDAVAGVSLQLQQAEVGSTVALTITRDVAAAVSTVQNFAAAFNEMQTLVRTNTAPGGDLAYNGSLKASARAFSSALLGEVANVSIARPTLVGVTLTKAGALDVDADVLTKALTDTPDGVRSLFALAGTTSGSSLNYVASSDRTAAGVYAVTVTAPATLATATSTGGTLPFASGGTTRQLTVTDGFTGRSGAVTLADGDDAAAIASKLSSMFASSNLRLVASVDGGLLTVKGTRFGTAGNFALAYDADDTVSATQLGLAAGSRTGLDISGTINGAAATGLGQTLAAALGDAADGLVVQYTGSDTGTVGSATVTVGVAARMSRVANSVTNGIDGTVASNVDALATAIKTLTARSIDVTTRLERQKQAMLDRFSVMEAALSRIQTAGSAITNLVAQLQNSGR